MHVIIVETKNTTVIYTILTIWDLLNNEKTANFFNNTDFRLTDETALTLLNMFSYTMYYPWG